MSKIFRQLLCLGSGASRDEDRSARAPSTPSAANDVGGGGHDIGWLGSSCLMANNVCGSAMVQIPGLFQAVGWLPGTLTFIVVSVWSTASSLYLARLIQVCVVYAAPGSVPALAPRPLPPQRLPGNAGFGQRVEFGRAAQLLLPHWAYLGVIFILVASLLSQARARARGRRPLHAPPTPPSPRAEHLEHRRLGAVRGRGSAGLCRHDVRADALRPRGRSGRLRLHLQAIAQLG